MSQYRVTWVQKVDTERPWHRSVSGEFLCGSSENAGVLVRTTTEPMPPWPGACAECLKRLSEIEEEARVGA